MTEIRQPIGEEMIIRVMQYCDGTLPAEEAELVARQIAADPALQALAEDFRTSADAARDTMAAFDNRPVPFAMARAIATAPQAEARSTSPRPSFIHSQVAAALFGLLLGAGVLGIWSASQRTDDGLRLAGAKSDGGDMAEEALTVDAAHAAAFRTALLSALNDGPEAPARAVEFGDQTSGQGQVKVLNWFKLASGTSCAEFEQAENGTTTGSGVACRREDGGWEVIVLPRTAP
jgi:hypothetical protein